MENQLPKIELAEGLKICPIINGLWQVSGGHGQINGASALEAMHQYYSNGFTSFDGADHYGPAEDLMGHYWSHLGKKATVDNVQFFTKWCPSPGPMTRKVVEAAIDKSLKRMQTNCLHLLQFHWWDYGDTRYIDALKQMSELQEDGKIMHLALTNFNTTHLSKIIDEKIKIVSNQVSYSIIDRRPENAMVPFCKKHGIKLLTYGTVLGGFLSEKYLGAPEPSKKQLNTSSLSKYKNFIDNWGSWSLFQELLRKLDEIAKKKSVSIANVACRYILDKPCVGGVIVGARLSLSEHIEDNKKIFSLTLDDSERAQIEEIANKGKKLRGDCGDEYRNC